MEMRGIMGGFYKLSEWIMRLSGINIMWFICSLPFFVVLMFVLTPELNRDMLLQIMYMAAAVAPFTLFPATTAMFTVARKWVMGDTDVPLIRTFFKGYKDNYKQSMLGGLLYAVLGLLLAINYTFYSQQAGTLNLLSILFIVFFVIMMSSLFYFFSILSHLHMKTLQIVKNALLITIGNPVGTIVMIICNLFILYISFFKYTFLIPFFMGSVSATFTFFMFHKAFLTIQIKQEQLEKAKQEKEAEENGVEEELAGASVKPVVVPGPELTPPASAPAEPASAAVNGAPESAPEERKKTEEPPTEPARDDIYLDDGKYTDFHKKFRK